MPKFTRKAMLALATLVGLVGLVGFVAAGPVTGVANAEPGSRLCGVYMVSPDNQKAVTRLYEVPKSNVQNTACEQAVLEDVTNTLFTIKQILGTDDFSAWKKARFSYVKCEDWTTRPLVQGGLETHNVSFEGSGWPAKDRNDLCNSMERSDSYLNMRTYWLAWYGGPLLYFYHG